MRAAAIALAALLAAAAASGCGPSIVDHTKVATLTKHLPATLEAEHPRAGDARTVKVHVYADAGYRAQTRWKEEIAEQLDYASQLLVPLAGVKLALDGAVVEWDRPGDPKDALKALAEADKGDEVVWVIGYVTPADAASKAMEELGQAEPLGRHVIVRAWNELKETEALAKRLPDMKDAERTEVLGAHRRHKQTVVLLHMLAATLAAIGETDPAWIQHPTYSSKMVGFSERNRELITLGVDGRLADTAKEELAKKLLGAIEKTPWGGWVPADHEQVSATLRNIIDATKSGRTADAVPVAAFDQFNRIRELAKRGRAPDALIELDNLLTAYPGNAAMHQLKCEIMLARPVEKGQPPSIADKATRTACARASDLAPGDPTVHLTLAEALARANDPKGARAELVAAEGKIANLKEGRDDAWRKIIAMYTTMGSLTWTEEALAKAKLDKDPAAAHIAQTRARYGIARGAKFVTPDQEAALVAAVRGALDLVYASKFGEAGAALAAAEKKWPGAPGLAAARCDLALRSNDVDGARAACSRALAADPNQSWALYLTGVILLREGGTTRAGIDKLKKAIEVDPELGQAWRTLAKAYARSKDKAALEQLGKDYAAKFGQPLPP
ncbi:MAG: hypothetical protein KIT31_23775 [Deltaproteobacteria bacterium]|nr:hypothetical protein [Deltaproteobacteria bacterium]